MMMVNVWSIPLLYWQDYLASDPNFNFPLISKLFSHTYYSIIVYVKLAIQLSLCKSPGSGKLK